MVASPLTVGPARWPGEPLVAWVRVSLVLIAAGLAGVFAVATRIDPYGPGGRAATMATHQQLGLPPCNFVTTVGIPCPACGLTTSFALSVRADAVNAARANWVGLLLAGFCALLIPWGVASAAAGRALFVRSLERAAVAAVLTLFLLLLLRWATVLWGLWRG
ncbi:MAG: DUF2752 domain-containing protein [Gemmataceae bacterium]